MKRLSFIVILVIFVIVSGKTLYSKNTTTKKEPENIVVVAHKEVFKKLEYGKVLFKHQNHVQAISKILNRPEEKICGECHIEDKYGEYSFEFPTNIDRTDPEKLKNAYHRDCIRCHQRLSAEGKKTGPEILSCRDCHKKEYETVDVKTPLFDFDFSIHYKHVTKQQKDCSVCHHIYDIEEKDKELALVYEKGSEQSCYYCHDFNTKRGPELTRIVNIAKQKKLNMEKACHQLCLNCHIKNKTQGKEAGPIVCSKCHTGRYKTTEELKDTPRPEMEQPKTAFINIDEAKMKGVSFNHSLHEKNNSHCRDCHHETLKACNQCHDIKGKEDGGFVNIVSAYHSLNSKRSCQGCHMDKINKQQCVGCHYFIPPVRAELGSKQVCEKCHTGKKKQEEKNNRISLENLKIKQELIINHLEKEFEPVKMPHGKMVKKLAELSNQSKLAIYFHGNVDTLCMGCHHKSKQEAKAKKENPPICISCHATEFSEKDRTRPRLEASYHGMCIKCHENMKLDKPKRCTDCHERKVKVNVYN